jgi:predicted Rossmann-fold nucleotide-binding protein
LDELFEMLTWNTLKIHDKKIILLNCNGFYDHLVAHMQMMQEQGFLYESVEYRLIVATSAKEAVALLQSF